MKAILLSGAAERVSSIHGEISRLLNLMGSRLRRKEVDLAEEVAEELLEKTMDYLLCEKAAKMNRLNRILSTLMKLLLIIVCTSLLFMVLNVQPLLGLKIFAAGYVMIALVVVANYYLFRRFYRAIHLMLETYKRDSKRFIGLLIDRVRVDDNPETALDMFCLAMMQ